eukprot:jgi/Orpsp1_1/1184023/evm.model.c7180000087701.1
MIHQEVGFFDINDIGDNSENTTTSSSSGSLTAKLSTEVGLVHSLNKNIGQVLQIIITFVGGLGVAFFNGWKLTLIAILAVPFLILDSVLRIKTSKKKNKENRCIFENSSKIVTEAIVSIKTIYSLNLSELILNIYNENLNKPLKRLERIACISSLDTGYSNIILYIIYILGFWVGSWFIDSGEMEFDKVFKVLIAIFLTSMAISNCSSIIGETQKAME